MVHVVRFKFYHSMGYVIPITVVFIYLFELFMNNGTCSSF